MTYKYVEIDSSLAERFWNKSPDRSPFTHPVFLSEIAEKVEYWGAYKNEELVCVWPITIEKDAPCRVPFFYYVGPLWSKSFHGLPSSHRYGKSQVFYNGLIGKILERHSSLSFDLPVTLQDVRSFSWWNYHRPDLPKFSVSPKYTARIENLSQLAAGEFVEQFKKISRRKRLKKMLEGGPGYLVSGSCSVSQVIDMYCETINANGGLVTKKTTDTLEKIIKLGGKAGITDVVTLVSRDQKQLVAAQVLVKDDVSVHAVAKCVKKEDKEDCAGVFLTYTSILKAQSDGADVFDFNGANSPNRAEDKHAYGAIPKLYFQIDI